MFHEAFELNWQHHGLLLAPDDQYWWSQTHAQCPVIDPEPLSPGLYTIYFSSRDSYGKSRIGSCILDVYTMSVVQYNSEPSLCLGTLGAFDDAGVMPATVVSHQNNKYLLYIGWMERKSVPYQNAIGLCKIDKNGQMQRVYPGPVISAWGNEAFFTGTINLIAKENCLFGYYLSCTGWHLQQGKAEPRYEIKIATTTDLLHWIRDGQTALSFDSESEGGYASVSVIKLQACYLMFYCLRGREDYRTNPQHSYKIYAAISDDALNWFKIPQSIFKTMTSFDQQMQCYPQVLQLGSKILMFYNGNHFGKDGFGCASIELSELEALCQIYKK